MYMHTYKPSMYFIYSIIYIYRVAKCRLIGQLRHNCLIQTILTNKLSYQKHFTTNCEKPCHQVLASDLAKKNWRAYLIKIFYLGSRNYSKNCLTGQESNQNSIYWKSFIWNWNNGHESIQYRNTGLIVYEYRETVEP